MSPILYMERAGGGSSGVSSPSGAVPALVWHGVTLCYRFCSLMALACGSVMGSRSWAALYPCPWWGSGIIWAVPQGSPGLEGLEVRLALAASSRKSALAHVPIAHVPTGAIVLSTAHVWPPLASPRPPSACDLLVQNVLQDGLTLIQEVIRGDDRAAEKGSSSWRSSQHHGAGRGSGCQSTRPLCPPPPPHLSVVGSSAFASESSFVMASSAVPLAPERNQVILSNINLASSRFGWCFHALSPSFYC